MTDQLKLQREYLRLIRTATNDSRRSRGLAPLTTNRGRRFSATNGDSGVAEILLYDQIGYGAITAADVAAQLKGINAGTIELRINSPGGDVFDATAIYNSLRGHGAKIITKVDGLAASAASVIAMAGDEIEMGTGSFLMIHDPWTYCAGTAGDLRDTADMLDQIGETISGFYAKRAGKSADYFKQKMADETWYSADDAVAEGLADRVGNDDADTSDVENSFDLSRFRNTPKALLNREDRELAYAVRQHHRDLRRLMRAA